MRVRARWLVAVVAVSLVACGGGPGDATYGGTFQVVQRSPAQGDTNVHAVDPFTATATFSRRLDATTVVDANVQVSGAGGVSLAKTLALSNDDTTLTISLLARPTLPADVKIVLTSNLKDVLGNALPQDEWTFSMPEWWEPFGTPPMDDMATVVLDGEGNPVIAWCGTGGIHVVRWTSGAWATMGQVLSRGGRNACPPALTYAPVLSGTTFADRFGVAWEEVDASNPNSHQAYAAMWNGTEWRDLAGGTVAGAAPLASSVGTYGMSPTLAFDSSGQAYASARVGTTVQAWQWPLGGTGWSAFGSLNTVASNQAWSNSAALTGQGFVVAWTESPTGTRIRDLHATLLSSNGAVTRLAGGSKLNYSGGDVLSGVVAPTTNPLIAFSGRDATSGNYAVQVIRATTTRITATCLGQIMDDPGSPVKGLAVAGGPDGTWLALTEGDQIRVKHCDATGPRLVGTPAIANAGSVAFLGFAGANSIPTVAYTDMGPPPPAGAPRLREWHFRIKQPNR